ncbi:MAG: TrmB family transcriptional regulator [Candidatus Woesearchaeota archaeon]
MIVQNELLNQLKAFGLNTYEAKLWMALLSKGVATAGELSDIANVPRSRSYDVLESLEKKGFIMMKLGKPIRYVAVKPSEVLERVKRKIQEDATTQRNIIEKIKDSEAFEELKVLHTQGIETIDPNELTGSIKGRANIYDHLSASIKGAEKSVFIMTTEEGLKRKAETLKKAFEKAKRKGIVIKIIAPVNQDVKDAVLSLNEVAEIRHYDNIKGRFSIVDQKELTFMLMDDQNINSKYDSAVWVNTDFFSSALIELFNKTWENSSPVEEKLELSGSASASASITQ